MKCGLCLELGEVDHAADVEADADQSHEEHEHTLKHELRQAGHGEAARCPEELNLDYSRHKVEHSLFKYFKFTRLITVLCKRSTLFYFGLPALILFLTRQTINIT